MEAQVTDFPSGPPFKKNAAIVRGRGEGTECHLGGIDERYRRSLGYGD
jgi:hypothetical protein